MDGASVCVSLITSARESHSLPLGNNTRYVCSCFIGQKKKKKITRAWKESQNICEQPHCSSVTQNSLTYGSLFVIPLKFFPLTFYFILELRQFHVHSRATQSSVHLYPFSHPGCHVKAEQSYMFEANCHPLAFRRYVCFQAMIRRPLGSECQT